MKIPPKMNKKKLKIPLQLSIDSYLANSSKKRSTFFLTQLSNFSEGLLLQVTVQTFSFSSSSFIFFVNGNFLGEEKIPE